MLAKIDIDQKRDGHEIGDISGTDVVRDDEDMAWGDKDVGWKKSSISISVPFHHRMKNPGAKEYHVGHLYHQSFVSVIREKLTNPDHDQNFHYEPFELFWKPTDDSVETRVHGELYTSPAFLEAYRSLQDSPREPGCDFPRVVVAMMFWSDSTQLASFGNAKLWPLYLFFGNESKYQQCKPTCKLGNHVAYFQTVSHIFLPKRCRANSDGGNQLPDAFKDFAIQHTGRKGISKRDVPVAILQCFLPLSQTTLQCTGL
jgi:hypothetical protein